MIRTLIQSTLGVAALTGGLAFGAASLAGAASPSSLTHPVNCTKAEPRAARIGTRETKATAWVSKAGGRQATATAADHPKVARRIAARITRVQKWEARGEKTLARIAAKCGGSAS